MTAPAASIVKAVSPPAAAAPAAPGSFADPVRGLAHRALAGWATTPGRLRAARALLVLLILLTGGLGGYGGSVRGDATHDIAMRSEPVSSDVIDAYQRLADADVMAAAGFLQGSPASAARERYEVDVERAAASLALVAGRSGGQPLTLDRVSDITASLTRYTAMVAAARAASGSGSTGGSEFEKASALMQSTLLRRAEALQRDQAEQLVGQYERAAGLPVLALSCGLVTLAILLVVQVRLFRMTRRILNVGLVAATVTIVGLTLWWALAFSISGGHLASARRHSRSATDALGQAQIAARQARSSEILALLVEPGSAGFHEEQFAGRAQRLSRDRGAGGALGAARRLSSSSQGPALIEAAVSQAGTWITAHDQARRLRDEGRHDEAVGIAVGPAAAAFDQLDTTLAAAVAAEQAALRDDVDSSGRALSGLVAGAALLALAAATCAARGIGKRMEDYR